MKKRINPQASRPCGRRLMRVAIVTLLLAGLRASAQSGTAAQQPGLPVTTGAKGKLSRSILNQPPTLSLSPAVIMAKGSYGEGITEQLTLTNNTGSTLGFDLIAEDVTAREGKRIFVPAGEFQGSIAATAVFLPRQVVVKPYSTATVRATFTIPSKTALRAAVAIFRGTNIVATKGSVGMIASLGTLFVFTLSNDFKVQARPITVTAQTGTSNTIFDQQVVNSGSEPVMPEGIAAILNMSGSLVGKATIRSQRLLPGEELPFTTEYPTQLDPGRYRVLVSFQYAGKTLTSSRDFTVR